MTTTLLVRPRTPLQSLSMNQPVQRRKSKRGSAYDEEDDGFKFTRASKRIKTAPIIPETSELQKSTTSTSTTRGKVTTQPENENVQATKKPTTRRSMDFATPVGGMKTKPPPRQGTRKSARLSLERNDQQGVNVNQNDLGKGSHIDENQVGPSLAEKKPKTRRTPQQMPPPNTSRPDYETSAESTKIALPFSDTPVINRNKEFRKTNGGRRRSSLGSRGRRASSLIDGGQTAMPHQEVDPAEYYKHIEAEGPSEPRRMKQLLMWCGERALGPRPAHNHPDSVALLSARPVQEQVLKAFATSSEMSDWFSREIPVVKPAVPKKPNPLDASNEKKIEELEAKIKKMKLEREQWKSLMKGPTPPSPLLKAEDEIPDPSMLDTALLDDEEQATLSTINSSSSTQLRETTKASLQTIRKDLEFQVDQFADGVHKLAQARTVMDKAAEKVMALSAVRMAERETIEKEQLGTKDMPIQEVLRALSRIGNDQR